MKIWLDTNIKTQTYIEEDYWKGNYNYVKEAILNAKVYVFEKDDTIEGFIGIVDNYIAGIFVKENMQGKGIGKSLIDECKKGNNILVLNVYEKNEKALKFYLREGFYIIDRNVDNDTGEKELTMKWEKIRNEEK